MSFGDYITEIRASELELESILYLIKRDCKPFLKRVKGAKEFLWRGMDRRLDIITKIVPRKNRAPKDTPQEVHDILDDLFRSRFGWKARSEGVFCYARKGSAEGYGTAHMVFPIGDWTFLWNGEVNDLYVSTKALWELGLEPSEDEYYEAYGEGESGEWKYNNQNADNPYELAKELAEEDRGQCEGDAEFRCGEEPSEEQEELFSGEYGTRNQWQNCYDDYVDECMGEKVEALQDTIESYREWMPELTWEEFAKDWRGKYGPDTIEDALESVVKAYKSIAFKKAITTNNEIMVQCDSYYAVNREMEIPLKKELLQGKMVVQKDFPLMTGHMIFEPQRKIKVKVRKM